MTEPIHHTCKTCIHWRCATPPLGSCNSPKLLKGYSYKDEDCPLDGARVEDDEFWAILTGPNFGCVNWERAE